MWGNYWALRQLDDYFGDVDEPNDPTLAAFQVSGCWTDDVPTQAEYEAVDHPRLTYEASSSDTSIVTVKLLPHNCVIPVVTGTDGLERQDPPPAYLRKNYLDIRTVGEGSATVSVTVTDHKGEEYTQTTDRLRAGVERLRLTVLTPSPSGRRLPRAAQRSETYPKG